MTATEMFDTQKLLFGRRPQTRDTPASHPDQQYHARGWTLVDDVPDRVAALGVIESLIAGVDRSRLATHALLDGRIELAKADAIPVCRDVVDAEYQILHFDMGMPFGGADQMLITTVGIYLPAATTHPVEAQTRLLPLSGLLSSRLSATELERRVLAYVDEHGDGWGSVNTQRIACLARLLDAAAGSCELADARDRTVGQWFALDRSLSAVEAYVEEATFFARHGIDLGVVEIDVSLRPGQLLVIDNTRVVHGRIGPRAEREIVNLMFGAPTTTADEVAAVRHSICEGLVA